MGDWEKTLERIAAGGLLPWGECRADGCENKRAAKGLCAKHYNRVRRYGSLFKTCLECGHELDNGQSKYCSDCRAGVTVRKHSEYQKRPEVKLRINAAKRERRKDPEEKAKKAAYNREYMSHPEARELKRIRDTKYRQKPDVKERIAEYKAEYRKRPEVKEAKRLKRQEPEEKLKMAAYAKEYNSRPEVKERRKALSAKYGWRYKPGLGLGGSKHIGPIAQDVEKYFPEAVVEINGIKTLDGVSVLGILLKAVQEMAVELRMLKN